MSKPLRFKPVNPAHEMVYSADGGWVSWEDYARLKAEVERLTLASQGAVKYVDHTMALTRQSMEHHKQVSRLEAQVERLTKAGDGLEDAIIDGGLNRMNEARDNWNAAKEGKQS